MSGPGARLSAPPQLAQVRARARSVLFTLVAPIALACGPGTPAPASAPAPVEEAPTAPAIAPVHLVLRPAALRRDASLGPFVDGTLRRAAAELPRTATAYALREVWLRAEQVTATWDDVREEAAGGGGGLFVEGVPADVDPAELRSPAGELLLHRDGDGEGRFGSAYGPVRVLSGRRWLLGGALPRPVPLPDGALALLRLAGPPLVAAIPRLRVGPLRPIGDGLLAITVTLTTPATPADGPSAERETAGSRARTRVVVATLTYGSAEGAERAREVLTPLAEAAARRGEGGLLGLLAAARPAPAPPAELAYTIAIDGSALRPDGP